MPTGMVAERTLTYSGLFFAFGRSADMGSSVKRAREGSRGEMGSENADVSSDKAGERPARRKSKGSCLKLI